MSKFEFPESIRSRPVWGALEPRAGLHHLMIADAEGAEAILDIAAPELMAGAHIIFIPKGTGFGEKLRALNPAQCIMKAPRTRPPHPAFIVCCKTPR